MYQYKKDEESKTKEKCLLIGKMGQIENTNQVFNSLKNALFSTFALERNVRILTHFSNK